MAPFSARCQSFSAGGGGGGGGAAWLCVGAAPGFYGMSGNAAELGDACDPAADGRPESDRCALHGGGFVHGEENVRCATYYLGPRSGRFADLGFRCCAD